MRKYTEIIALSELKKRNLISADIFEEEENNIWAKTSSTTYTFLALFLGWLGLHNVYANRIYEGIFQSLLMFISFVLLNSNAPWYVSPILFLVLFVWSILDIIFIKKDGKGYQMKNADNIRRTAAWLMVFQLLFATYLAFTYYYNYTKIEKEIVENTNTTTKEIKGGIPYDKWESNRRDRNWIYR